MGYVKCLSGVVMLCVAIKIGQWLKMDEDNRDGGCVVDEACWFFERTMSSLLLPPYGPYLIFMPPACSITNINTKILPPFSGLPQHKVHLVEKSITICNCYYQEEFIFCVEFKIEKQEK